MKRVRKILLPVLASLCLAGVAVAQDVDLKALDRLGEHARSKTVVTLNAALLKLGAAFLGADGDSDADAIKSLIGKLRAIYVREYEYSSPGEYSDKDLAAFRAMLSSPRWTQVVDVQDHKESSQIYFLMSPSSGKLGGVAVMSAEPKKVTVVYIDGELDPSDIAKLSGNMGIPEIHDLDRIRKRDNKSGK
jgi:hypothetical protein